MWRKRDSENLESIAKSLEKLVEREQERFLVDNTPVEGFGILSRIKQHIQSSEKINVTDGLNPNIAEDVALEEELKLAQRMNAKASTAKKEGNVPFWVEDLFEEEELETLQS